MILPWFSSLPFGIAQRDPHLQDKAPEPARANSNKKRLYQVGVFIQLFRVPILIQLRQNTLNGVFLNTAWTKCVKTGIKIFFFFLVLQKLHVGFIRIQCLHVKMCNQLRLCEPNLRLQPLQNGQDIYMRDV